MTMDIEGIINPINFGDILYSIYSQQETGILYLKDNNIIKTIYIKGGNIMFALSNQNEDRFGEVLLKEGLITISQFYESSRLISKTKKQGTVLVEMGAIKDEDLLNTVRFQVRQIVSSIFKWKAGKYVFHMQENLNDHDIIDLNLSIPNLIMEGMRRTQSWLRIEQVLFNYPVRIRRSFNYSRIIKAVDLTKKEYGIFQLLEKPMELEDIFDHVSGATDFEVCNIVWRLVTVKLLEKINLSKKTDNYKDLFPYAYNLIEKYNDFFILIHDILDKEFGLDRETLIKDRLDPIFKKYTDFIDKQVFYSEGFFEPRTLFDSIKSDDEKSIILILREVLDAIHDEFITICSSYLSKNSLPDVLSKSKEIQYIINKL